MISVTPANEPEDFDQLVRQPGLIAIAELVGQPASTRRGKKRRPLVANRNQLRPEHFPPYWRRATDQLLIAYDRVCAYACLYIERITGSATVDHWAPKSLAWDHVYEWNNYRLACSIMNARKRDYGDIIDPFDVQEGWFALDLVTLKVVPGPNAGAKKPEIEKCIRRLGLDSADYVAALEEYYHEYMEGFIKLCYLKRRAPFLASELKRQGKLRSEDDLGDIAH